MSNLRPIWYVATAALVVVLVSPAATAQNGAWQLNESGNPPPAELPQAFLQAPLSKGIEVSRGGELQAEFWLTREPPSGGPGGMALGVNFNNFPVGAFLGVVQLKAPWRDYKNLSIPAGIYTLRYGQQPADGNHTGSTLYRDFALLVPIEQELEPAFSGAEPELDRLSREATGTPHPGVMALFPVWDAVEGVQIVPNEIGQPSLVWHFGDAQAGFVLEGHGELEGY